MARKMRTSTGWLSNWGLPSMGLKKVKKMKPKPKYQKREMIKKVIRKPRIRVDKPRLRRKPTVTTR